MGRQFEVIGKRFGSIVVQDLFFDESKRPICVCKCDCGNVVNIRYVTVKCERFKGHCGCQPHKGKGKKHNYKRAIDESDVSSKVKQSIATFMSEIKEGKYDYRRSTL